jgi:hypothetical protein
VKHLKPHDRFFIPNYHFLWTDRSPGRKGKTAFAVRKDIPHNHVDLLSFVSIKTTGVCISFCNNEVLLTPVCKPLDHGHQHDTSICMGLKDHVTLNFSNNIPTAAVPRILGY